MIFFRKLSLSTNMIEKITGLSGMKNLKILSVGRNYIKSFAGLVKLLSNLNTLLNLSRKPIQLYQFCIYL